MNTRFFRKNKATFGFFLVKLDIFQNPSTNTNKNALFCRESIALTLTGAAAPLRRRTNEAGIQEGKSQLNTR
jgi:hypothetical protein